MNTGISLFSVNIRNLWYFQGEVYLYFSTEIFFLFIRNQWTKITQFFMLRYILQYLKKLLDILLKLFFSKKAKGIGQLSESLACGSGELRKIRIACVIGKTRHSLEATIHILCCCVIPKERKRKNVCYLYYVIWHLLAFFELFHGFLF